MNFYRAQAMHQGVAVLGIALIAAGEPLGAAMAQRSLEHMLQYCEPPVRRAVRAPPHPPPHPHPTHTPPGPIPPCPPITPALTAE
jgi:hypothetical protein